MWENTQDSESLAKKYLKPLITQKYVLIDSLLLRRGQNTRVVILHARLSVRVSF